MPLGKTVLDNGMTVVSEQVPHLDSVTAGIWVNAGSRGETLADNGISHFIEHMLFKGTPRRGPADISREIEAVGGMMNAYTDREYTFVFAKALAKDFPLVVDLLCDVFLESRFDEDEMEREKGVVLQELLMVEDDPEDALCDFFHASYWDGHPLGYPVQGTSGNVAGFTRERIRRFFSDRFLRRGAVVSVVGSLPHAETAKAFSRAMGGARLGERLRNAPPPSPARGVFFRERPIEQLHIVMGGPSVSRSSPERHAARILNAILGGGASSRLFQEIREKRGLAYSIGSSVSSYSDAGILSIGVGTTPDKAREVIEVTSEVLGELREGRFDDAEFGRGREQIKGSLILALESSEYRMSRLAVSEMFLGGPEPHEEELRGLDAATPDEVRALAATMLRGERFALAAMGHPPPGGTLVLPS
jgi:predicted Zn-dependent peptidase